ncbi:glycoside hydrolase, partial [Fennellomyces sp. T-0311]
LPIEYIPWSQVTHINYGFATMNENVVPTLSNRAQLEKLVQLAHQNNVKVLLSVGGWHGSQLMGTMMSNIEHRAAFVTKVLEWVDAFDIDGNKKKLELHKRTTLPCNRSVEHGHGDNFVPLLRELRHALDTNNGTEKLLTMASGATPFRSTNVTEYKELIDWVFIMAYDTYVGQSYVGPNAPLYTSSKRGTSPNSVAQAWDAWNQLPSHQLVVGLPFYGYASKPRNHTETLLGTKLGFTGLWKWRSLRNAGLLLDEQTPGGHWIKNWDMDSQTPWLYNAVSNVVISYDDPDSLSLKAHFAQCQKARGVGIWDL